MRVILLLTWLSLAVRASAGMAAVLPYPAIGHLDVPGSKDEPWYRECMRVADHPGIDKPAVEAQGPQSGASMLYYQKRSQAATSQAEWNGVRQAALAQGDDAVLMMMYANGFGVPRNTDIATYYACDMRFAAQAETRARVTYLSSAPSPTRVFDQCDHVTSGMMGGVCADIRQSQDRRVREAHLDRAAQSLPASAKATFKRLRTAADAYANAAWKEVDGHGTGAAGFAIEHQEQLREQFMQSVLDLLGNQLGNKVGNQPGAMPDRDTARLDAALNAVYQRLMSTPSSQADAPDRLGESTIGRTELRNIERLWIAYRDAFLAFAATLPATSRPNPIAARLISQRIADLNGIARYL